jgi:hypothetical protein
MDPRIQIRIWIRTPWIRITGFQCQANLLCLQVPAKVPGEEATTQLEAEVAAIEPRVQALSELGRTLSQGSGSTQAREILNRHDRIRKRWRYVFTETQACRDPNGSGSVQEQQQHQLQHLSPRSSASPTGGGAEEEPSSNGNSVPKNANLIDAWAEEALAALAKSCNVSELKDLRQNIRHLQVLQAGLADKKAVLEELLAQFGGNNATACQESRHKLEKVGQLLPKRLANLVEKSDRLVQMVEDLEADLRWLAEMQERHHNSDPATAANNNNNEDQTALRLAVGEKEYAVNKLMVQFQQLEREVVGAGLPVNPVLVAEMAELRTRWFQLTAAARHVTSIVSSSVPSSSLIPSAGPITFYSAAEMPKTLSSHSVSSFVSGVSLTSPTSQSSEPWAASATTNTASPSPMSEEVVPLMTTATAAVPEPPGALLWTRARRLKEGLASLGEPGLGINVADTQSVGVELDRLR